ncbi:glycosyltransferase family 4 protein [Leptospira sp. GIMC2001]|uniref:glycosyltransferase family 4 protein n=1 Tax=Leptospira sp. GIMC2001 TaxID=1513297 RepID=UPI00234B5E27|nr:glycosyltransferase family 4 protein [Leptospira sp. GIMC2001]WCL49576.1 glycosyltransferase family 4 protein [Leptospira sp. GIMC2001]
MKKPRLCQFSTGFHPGDAISQEMLLFDREFRNNGWESLIFSEHIAPSVKKKANRFINYKPDVNDVLIYHHSIHSDVLEFVLELKSPKILVYHNVTPAHFFEPYDLQFSYSLKKGKEELLEIRKEFVKAYADSEFNCSELMAMGYENVQMLPISYDFNSLNKDFVVRNKYEHLKILFVGRITPNKKQDDLIRFAEVFRSYFRKDFQIEIVGYSSPASKYYMDELERMVRFWNLEDNIHFSGYVTHPELIGYYKEADVFLSMSEHEGFCVPLLEAMHFDIPILAYAAGAVPDTLNGSGILFSKKDYAGVGEMIEEITTNKKFRDSILQGQRNRIEEYKKIKSEDILVHFIENL